MSEDHRLPLAYLGAAELARQELRGSACGYLHIRELTERVGLTPAQILREAADAVAAGQLTVSAIEIVSDTDA